MTLASNQQICVEETPYYHVVSRCVRRAFLCGQDKYSGRSYEHRRGMIVERIKYLSSVFNIDILAYAIMSNHYHIVLKVNSTKSWSNKQVLSYWSELFGLNILCSRYIKGEDLTNAEMQMVLKDIEEYRKRLMSVSWFMKLLNEYIAREANKEDKVKGHFWESRFKSQALLDERALLTAMAYVDLNPIRAAMARAPEQSDYTSIQARIKKKQTWLLGFSEREIPFYFSDYLALVDTTGRAVLENKRASISNTIPDVFERLDLNPETWLDELKSFRAKHKTAVGTLQQLRDFCSSVGKQFRFGVQLKPQLE